MAFAAEKKFYAPGLLSFINLIKNLKIKIQRRILDKVRAGCLAHTP